MVAGKETPKLSLSRIVRYLYSDRRTLASQHVYGLKYVSSPHPPAHWEVIYTLWVYSYREIGGGASLVPGPHPRLPPLAVTRLKWSGLLG